MNKVLYLTFYFEPDLSACSFRNSPLVKELAYQAKTKASVDVLTTIPNRYESSMVKEEKQFVQHEDNYTVYRFEVPENKGGMKSQILSYQAYYRAVNRHMKNHSYDMVIASTAKLFTGYLAHRIAKKQNVPLYLDVRDLFYENLTNMLKGGFYKKIGLSVIKNVERKTFENAAHINLISEGFKPNFDTYVKPNYSFFTNGIDAMFLDYPIEVDRPVNSPFLIVYAGNIGEGQGLHKIIPEAAKRLGSDYQFVVIGEGGSKIDLITKIEELRVTNVELRNPVKRNELLEIYNECDYTFVHLNDYDSFKKVIPSKIFELACFPQPMIVGVSGFPNNFVLENVENHILFQPCDVEGLVKKLKGFKYKKTSRTDFMRKFKRSSINKEMAKSMLNYLK